MDNYNVYMYSYLMSIQGCVKLTVPSKQLMLLFITENNGRMLFVNCQDDCNQFSAQAFYCRSIKQLNEYQNIWVQSKSYTFFSFGPGLSDVTLLPTFGDVAPSSKSLTASSLNSLEKVLRLVIIYS